MGCLNGMFGPLSPKKATYDQAGILFLCTYPKHIDNDAAHKLTMHSSGQST